MSVMREPNAEPVAGYRLIAPLGSGGFGEAWKCEAPGGITKAIKFVFGNLNSLDVDGARAEQELNALNRIKEVRHPFILQMDRIEVVEGELVIVMELADRNLHDRYEECVGAGLVGIPRDELLRYVRDAAEALDHMNEKHNLQHLDIKPRNLFLVSDRVKVADFGLVKHLERSGASGILGGVTPLYAPPETFTGNISGRSDQYSLAVVYQELLTGQRPFSGKNARQLAHQHMNEEPELRALPEGERPVVARALAKDPAKRFPNCLAFVRALFQARGASRPEVSRKNGAPVERPKTMVDTMEDILLEQLPVEKGQLTLDDDGGSSDDEVVLGEPAAVDGASQLGRTVAQPQTGSVRPTLVIGVGGFGRRALLELRCRFLDRFGDLEKTSVIRFLYIDSDADAVKEATRGSQDVAFRPSEVHHLPLQPVSHYRRRQLDHLNDWMPREKLFAMPRSLKTQGCRALGRLAFTDNYRRLMGTFKREVQKVCHPDSIYRTVSETGLALRDGTPRVYIVAAASGGGGGCLADLGYALRRLLKQLNHPDSPVTALLFCGAPDDPATPAAEQANLYAALTELNHFADPAVPFAAQYGADGPRLVDEGSAYDNVYLLPLINRSPEGRRDAMAHLGSYLFHELTTPLGLRLDRIRQHRSDADLVPFRSLGTYGVWFPRGLLLRLAARGVCRRLFEEWQAAEDEFAGAETLALIEAAQARVLADPALHPEALAASVAEAAARHMEGPPADALAAVLANIEEQSRQALAVDDPGAWARQAVGRVREWLGGGVQPPGASTLHHRKSRLTRALETAAAELAERWDERFAESAVGLMEHPGRRVAAAEAALNRFTGYCDEAAAAYSARLQGLGPRTTEAQQQLEAALESCVAGANGFSWFGGRSRRQLRVFIDHLAASARQCLAEDVGAVVGQFFLLLRGRIGDRLRDLTFVRQRLRHMQEALGEGGDGAWAGDPETATEGRTVFGGGPGESSPTPLASADSFWESIRESATNRVVLPDGADQLEVAAERFLAALTPEHWAQLDQSSQDHVLAQLGGLYQACMNTPDLVRHLAAPLVNQAVATLSDFLPITDVAEVELAAGAGEWDAPDAEATERVHSYFERAAPLVSAAARGVAAVGARAPAAPVAAATPAAEEAFLLVPASEAGRTYGEGAKRALPHVHLVSVPGQADLMFCREQLSLAAEDLERILRSCRAAYESAAMTPVTSPHARFDVQDWTPLDP
jgi:serine/threonine protein kinase